MTNKLISLDVFDTALFRAVFEPTDIFKLIEDKVGNNFFQKRVEAENKARGKDPYYNIADIYEFLPEFDVQMEISMEFNNCIANQKLLKEYNKNPNRFVFISDMYLPSSTLIGLLKNIGYKNPRVFVSCEQRACKADGRLFERVQSILGPIDTHYGDNYVADIEGAKKAGIKKVVFNPALHNEDLSLPMIRNPQLKKLIALMKYHSPKDQIIFAHAPLVSEFTKWVLANREPGQKVFFLSRDMYVPYLLAKNVLKAPDVYYIHVSRRSIANACLQSKDKEIKERISLIFSEEEIERRKKADTSEILSYLNKFGIQDGDIIVDIGYAGTIQHGINSILGINTKGYYMQTDPEISSKLDVKMYFNRRVINYCLMIEVALGSPEDCVEGYKNGKVITKPENKDRKRLAKEMIPKLFEYSKALLNLNISTFDVEQILIHLQYYPSDDIIQMYNQNIYSNRELGESVIGFDKEKIVNGKLRECYNRSYAKPLFKRLLEADKDLKHLSKLLD